MNQSESGGAAHCRRRRAQAYRRRNYGPPSTPLSQWKFEEGKTSDAVSARKLAAGLWQLRSSKISWRHGLKFNFGPSNPSRHQSRLESSLPYPECASERATKWDPGCSRESYGISPFYSHMKLLKECQFTPGSIVSTLNEELSQARFGMLALEGKRHLLKREVKHLSRKLEYERIYWKSRAQQKNRTIEGLKAELGSDKGNRQQMENLNTDLVNRLASAKLSVEQFMKNYDQEKKSRKLMEDVCKELAEEIGKDKAQVMELKRESVKVLKQVEEERKMLQIAEVWREEQVQMKLIDAKQALEDRYCQLNKLIADVETFLNSRFRTMDTMELRKAELLLQAVKSLNIQDIEEMSYVPPKSDDVFSVFEEHRLCAGNDREIEGSICYSPSSHDSTVHPVSPEDNGSDKPPLLMQLNRHNDHNNSLQEDARGCNNNSHAEDQGSCASLEGRNPSINRAFQARNASRGRSNDKAGQYSPDAEISGVCSTSEKQSKQQKSSSTSKLWRSFPSNGEQYKIVLDEGEKRLSNGITSSLGTNPHRASVGQCIRTDIANPHITRGMKGCIEWPRAIQKNGSKAKLLEAKVENQKSQLRHVLKHKVR